MTRELFELVGAEDRRFSPYCWRVRLALAHKGLDATYLPVAFGEKEKIAFSGQKLVPVLRDGDDVVSDSWAIATYLEDRYADRRSLFGGPIGRAEARFFNEWLPTMGAAIMRIIVKDIHDRIRPADQPYFRESREARFGRTLEDMHAEQDAHCAQFDTVVAPLRGVLTHQPYFCGDLPAYADYIVFGNFQTARLMSPAALVEPGDVLFDWRERMLDLYDGMARNAPACAA